MIGARFAGEGDYQVRGPRRWSMALLSLVLSAMAGCRLTDTTSGFRACDRSLIELFADWYPVEYLGDTVETLVRVIRLGYRVQQVPVAMRRRFARHTQPLADQGTGLSVPGLPDPPPRTHPPMRLLTKALGVLPTGTLQVGAGLMVFGGAAYVHLAVAGHSLSTRGMAAMSVLWSIVFLLGLGLFFPVEQELIRHVAARVAGGRGRPARRAPCRHPRRGHSARDAGAARRGGPAACRQAVRRRHRAGGGARDGLRGAGRRLGVARCARGHGKVRGVRRPARDSTAGCGSRSPSRSASRACTRPSLFALILTAAPLIAVICHAPPGAHSLASGPDHHLEADVPWPGPAHRVDAARPAHREHRRGQRQAAFARQRRLWSARCFPP